MEKRSDFVLQFASLPAGEHSFEYIVNDSFFKAYEHPLLNKANVSVSVQFQKSMNGFQLSIDLKGFITLECGRCLEEFDMPVILHEDLTIRLVSGEVEESEDEMIVNISDHAHAFDLAPHLYDYLSLQVPINAVHSDKKNGKPGCDPKAIELLNKASTKKQTEEIDPRWDVLRKIKLN